jgi:hypothetical protein
VFKFGAVVGFAVGYYLGARAGEHRAEQIERLVRWAARTDIGETASQKARAVVDLGIERARQAASAN